MAGPPDSALMMRRHMDDPATTPNVHGLAQHLEHNRTTQIVEYDRGVGIAWYNGMTGGAYKHRAVTPCAAG